MHTLAQNPKSTSRLRLPSPPIPVPGHFGQSPQVRFHPSIAAHDWKSSGAADVGDRCWTNSKPDWPEPASPRFATRFQPDTAYILLHRRQPIQTKARGQRQPGDSLRPGSRPHRRAGGPHARAAAAVRACPCGGGQPQMPRTEQPGTGT